MPLESLDLAHRICDIASDKQATDVLILDIRNLTTIADYFVICSAATDRQMKAITDALDENLTKVGVSPLHAEGLEEGAGWILIDYGDVIAHLFLPAERDFYRLERLWSAATTVLRLQ